MGQRSPSPRSFAGFRSVLGFSLDDQGGSRRSLFQTSDPTLSKWWSGASLLGVLLTRLLCLGLCSLRYPWPSRSRDTRARRWCSPHPVRWLEWSHITLDTPVEALEPGNPHAPPEFKRYAIRPNTRMPRPWWALFSSPDGVLDVWTHHRDEDFPEWIVALRGFARQFAWDEQVKRWFRTLTPWEAFKVKEAVANREKVEAQGATDPGFAPVKNWMGCLDKTLRHTVRPVSFWAMRDDQQGHSVPRSVWAQACGDRRALHTSSSTRALGQEVLWFSTSASARAFLFRGCVCS